MKCVFHSQINAFLFAFFAKSTINRGDSLMLDSLIMFHEDDDDDLMSYF